MGKGNEKTEIETRDVLPQPRNSWSYQEWTRFWKECQPTDTLILNFWSPQLWKNKLLLF
jgi:hypothetical protein